MKRGHVPIRTCLVCAVKKPKRYLVRVALSFEAKSVVVDRDQCVGGRGGYVCPECLPRLSFTKRVQKAFRNKAKGLAPDVGRGTGRV